MSQKVTRKAVVSEDKEKNKAESPVKDMKKKMAANAEKEKQAEEKADRAEKSSEKTGEKSTEKSDKSADKKSDKSVDKKSEKKDNVEKKSDKVEQQTEKSKAESSKEEKSKPEKEKPESKKADPTKTKHNGKDRVQNGVSDVPLGNGTSDALNGTVSADSDDDDVMLVIDDHDEMFPELKYDDTSDMECSEPPTPENVPSRSFTRRSQVKATRTPETPRPASDKQTDSAEDPKDGSKILKLKDDGPTTDRKLRSSDATKPQEGKKEDSDKKTDTDNKNQDDKQQDAGAEKKEENEKLKGQEKEAEGKDVVGEKNLEGNKSEERKIEIELVVDVEANEGEGEEIQRKTDTNYSKSRVKVSPYRRSMRLADQTNTSLLANYTGNNTTMEMDITESSSIIEDANLDDSSYLRGLRSIRGRSSYKPLKEMAFKHIVNKSVRSNTSVNISSSTEINRPTGTVVGRKRKPDFGAVETATEATSDVCGDAAPLAASSKRMRVLDRLAEPFRRVASVSLPSVSRRNADIVGINTDLPLSAPVVTEAFDPESLKSTVQSEQPIAVPLPVREQDSKRCVLM